MSTPGPTSPPGPSQAITALQDTNAAQYASFPVSYWSSVPVDSLVSLTYSTDPNLGNQVVGLPSEAWANFTTTQLQSFTTSQVPAIPVASLQNMNADSNGKFPLLSSQVEVLTISQVSGLLSSQVSTFTQAQIVALSSTNIIPKIPIGTLQYFTPTQIPYFTTDQISALTTGTQTSPKVSNQVLNLTKDQVSALTTAQIDVLSDAQTLELTSTQDHVTAITSSQVPHLKVNTDSFTSLQFSYLSASQIALLTISATTPQVAQIPNLSNLVTSLSSLQIKAFTTAQIPYFTSDTISSFSASQIQAFTIGASSSLAQVQAFTNSQMSSFLMPSFLPSQVAVLNASQVSGFTNIQLGKLDVNTTGVLVEGQLTGLTDVQITHIKTQFLNAGSSGTIIPIQIPLNLIPSLTDTQISNIKNDHIYSLPSVKLQAVTSTQMLAFTPTQMRQWADTNISVFTSAQIEPLCSVGNTLLSNVYTSQFQLFSSSVKLTIENALDFFSQVPGQSAPGALSANQKATLDKYPLWVTSVTSTAINALNNPLYLTYLLAAQITYLSYGQISAVKNASYNTSTYYSRDSLSAFNANILAMTTLASLEVTQSYPPTHQLSKLDPSVSVLSVLGNTLTLVQLNAFTQQQFKALNPVLISPVVISGINDSQFAYWSSSNLESLSSTQVGALTQAQLSGTNLSDLFGKAVTDKALAFIQLLTPTQIGYFPSAIKKQITDYIQSNTSITFNITQFNSVDVAPVFQTNMISLGSYDEKVQFNFSVSDASKWIRYKIINNIHCFFTENKYFKPANNSYSNITCWSTQKITNSTLTIPQNFVQYLIHTIAPSSTQFKGDASKYYFNNVDTQTALLGTDINRNVNTTIHTSLDVLDDATADSQGVKTIDAVSGLYYTPLRGLNGDSTPMDVPTQVYETFEVYQPTRLDTNLPDANGFYNMPFKVGDFVQFLLVVSANSANGANISRTYLMELDIV